MRDLVIDRAWLKRERERSKRGPVLWLKNNIMNMILSFKENGIAATFGSLAVGKEEC